MSDNDPNKKLNDKRLQIEIGTLQVNLQRFDLRLMEIEEERLKVLENIAATNKRVAEITKVLSEGK